MSSFHESPTRGLRGFCRFAAKTASGADPNAGGELHAADLPIL